MTRLEMLGSTVWFFLLGLLSRVKYFTHRGTDISLASMVVHQDGSPVMFVESLLPYSDKVQCSWPARYPGSLAALKTWVVEDRAFFGSRTERTRHGIFRAAELRQAPERQEYSPIRMLKERTA